MLSREEKLRLLGKKDTIGWEDYDRDVYDFIECMGKKISPLNWEDRVRRAITHYAVDYAVPEMFAYIRELEAEGMDKTKALWKASVVVSNVMFELGFCFGAYYKGSKRYHRR